MRHLPLSLFSLLLLSAISLGGGAIAQPLRLLPTSGYTLAWSDEFAAANGSTPDRTKWAYNLGGGGWGNQCNGYDIGSPHTARRTSLDAPFLCGARTCGSIARENVEPVTVIAYLSL